MNIENESPEEREAFDRMQAQPTRAQLIAEVAVLTELVRVLSDRVAELEGKSADCFREMYALLQNCENEMRYAGWGKLQADNSARNDVYEQVKSMLEKNNGC
jgi:hypothetical protein